MAAILPFEDPHAENWLGLGTTAVGHLQPLILRTACRCHPHLRIGEQLLSETGSGTQTWRPIISLRSVRRQGRSAFEVRAVCGFASEAPSVAGKGQGRRCRSRGPRTWSCGALPEPHVPPMTLEAALDSLLGPSTRRGA